MRGKTPSWSFWFPKNSEIHYIKYTHIGNHVNKCIIIRSSQRRCSIKKVFLEILQNSQENTCARDSFLIKLLLINFIKKESLAQVFSCEFCEISKNNFFTEQLRRLLLQVNEKNSFSHTPSCILPSFSQNTSRYFFQRGFESVQAKFLSGNINVVLPKKQSPGRAL